MLIMFISLLIHLLTHSLTHLLNQSLVSPHTFRIIKNRIYYVSDAQLKLACNVGRDNLISVGVCFGKFTKNLKFRLAITCMDYLSQYAQHKGTHLLI